MSNVNGNRRQSVHGPAPAHFIAEGASHGPPGSERFFTADQDAVSNADGNRIPDNNNVSDLKKAPTRDSYANGNGSAVRQSPAMKGVAVASAGSSAENSGSTPSPRGLGREGSGTLHQADVAPKAVMVGLKLKSTKGVEICAESKDVLSYAMNQLVSQGDVLYIVSVFKLAEDQAPAEKSHAPLEAALQPLLETWLAHARAKRVSVCVTAPYAHKLKQGLITEALAVGASTLLLGRSSTWARGFSGQSDSWAEFGVYALPPTCTVMVVKKNSVAYAKTGTFKGIVPPPRRLPSPPGGSPTIFTQGGFGSEIVIGPGRTGSPCASSSATPSNRGSRHLQELVDNPGDQEYTYAELVEATEDFSKKRLLGAGGCGEVFLGELRNKLVAVKRMRTTDVAVDAEAWKQIVMEIRVLKRVFHRNLVGLRGFCIQEDGDILLIFEYMSNGSLFRRLRDPALTPLTWAERLKITRGTAEGLRYLHEFCRPPIIHRDVKAANILLDDDLEARVADFGLAKLVPEGQGKAPLLVTQIMGTNGYVAPEYQRSITVTEAIDVYSFGVVLFEILSGQAPFKPSRNPPYLVDWAHRFAMQEDFELLMDPKLRDEYSRPQAKKVAMIAAVCTSSDPRERPTMSKVIQWLERVEGL
eukprot:TRINITY_DN19329_c0_g1_i1.p1 TRINITY_DN19329_c0_g1~~TRINITY_DN19329_c0_g1_i1.p1  ORF type:complete len:641 (+),score=100.74 TRINITY_DN19329_c0_g1_i1:185-2107(+)